MVLLKDSHKVKLLDLCLEAFLQLGEEIVILLLN